jgi:hypothetical protein
VYWSCAGRSDVSRIRDLSFGGIFVETHQPQPVGAKAQIDFLVEEGQIRTEAVVRHVEGASGMGLEFSGVAQEDGPRLGALLTRLRLPVIRRPRWCERSFLRRVPTTLRQVLAKFSEFCVCWVFRKEISRQDRVGTTIADVVFLANCYFSSQTACNNVSCLVLL